MARQASASADREWDLYHGLNPGVRLADIALQTFHQSLEGDPAAWTVAQVHVHGDPGVQCQDADGSQMAEAIRRVVARRTGRSPRVVAFPWWLLMLASQFVARIRFPKAWRDHGATISREMLQDNFGAQALWL